MLRRWFRGRYNHAVYESHKLLLLFLHEITIFRKVDGQDPHLMYCERIRRSFSWLCPTFDSDLEPKNCYQRLFFKGTLYLSYFSLENLHFFQRKFHFSTDTKCEPCGVVRNNHVLCNGIQVCE